MIAAHHAATGGGKTVYARRISNATALVDWASLADEYFHAFPQTFRFMFATPNVGCWLGATPELLLQRESESGRITTMALAGTLRNDTDQWDAKNIEEHDYVTRFIVDTFTRFGIKAEVSPAEDVRFGAIRHLCHRISAEYSGPIVPLLNALSPTPALSGFPRNEALDIIGKVESPRSLYGGYVGINTPNGIHAYVNLRSMCFNPDGGYCIYSGGGITSQSDPADEWLETEAKSAVLRQCITNHTLNFSKPTPTTPNDSES
jgi:isochorismate synthase